MDSKDTTIIVLLCTLAITSALNLASTLMDDKPDRLRTWQEREADVASCIAKSIDPDPIKREYTCVNRYPR